ncbi:MAG: methyltransferase protein [Cyanobacteria bacterium RYN_339]|nr:methyltransferase protein [Cyanobacteria bacterium RYN_339]
MANHSAFKVKASSIRGALAPWRYETTLNQWIGGKAGSFREFTANLVEVTPGESVLDLGCGTGELALMLSRRVGPTGHVAGIDLSKALVAGARRRAKRAGLAIDYRVASIAQLPFADATVDVVVSSLVMHHLAPDVLARAVGEIRRVLRPGGRVFIIDFQSLEQAGHGHERGHAHGHQHGHAHGHRQEQPTQHGLLHDHRPVLVGLLKEAGLTDAAASPVEFGQRLEVTRGRLTT